MEAQWKEKAIALYREGKTVRQIAPIVGVTFQRVHQVVRNYSPRKHLRKEMTQKTGVNPYTLSDFAQEINAPRLPSGQYDYFAIEDKIKEHFIRRCPVCGKEFVVTKLHRKYDSEECGRKVENAYHLRYNTGRYHGDSEFRQKRLESNRLSRQRKENKVDCKLPLSYQRRLSGSAPKLCHSETCEGCTVWKLLFEPNPNESRLLTDGEIAQACRDGFVWYPIVSTADRNIANAQLAKDQLYEQARVERIFKWSEAACPHWINKKGEQKQKRLCPYCWQALKKKEESK